jgi:hypothetical protein
MLLGVLNPLLRPHLEVLGGHFGGDAENPLAVQRVDVAGARTALFVSKQDGKNPMLLLVDGDHLAWSKPFPTLGIAPPFDHLALAPRPRGGVALFGYGAAMHQVVARMWADDGTPEPDLRVASFNACDKLSVAYSRELGWVVACASRSGVSAQRLDEERGPVWGERGVAVGEAAVGRATVVFDTAATWVLVERAHRSDADHVLAFRYDAKGQPLWPAAADIGVPAGPSYRTAWVEPNVAYGGTVRLDLPSGLIGRQGNAVEVGQDGEVRNIGP